MVINGVNILHLQNSGPRKRPPPTPLRTGKNKEWNLKCLLPRRKAAAQGRNKFRCNWAGVCETTTTATHQHHHRALQVASRGKFSTHPAVQIELEVCKSPQKERQRVEEDTNRQTMEDVSQGTYMFCVSPLFLLGRKLVLRRGEVAESSREEKRRKLTLEGCQTRFPI